MNLRCAASSHVGGRDLQEDAFLLAPELGLFAVADGMGANMSARPLADLALARLRERYAGGVPGDERAHLVAAVESANDLVFERTSGARRAWDAYTAGTGPRPPNETTAWMGSGATLVALRLSGAQALVAHAGDCRAYLWERRGAGGGLRPLTVDHRLREAMREAGLPESEIAAAPSNVVTRAIGVGARVDVTVTSLAAPPGALLLLTSDGLTDALSDPEIEAILAETAGLDLDAVVAELLRRAMGARPEVTLYRDNATALLVATSD